MVACGSLAELIAIFAESSSVHIRRQTLSESVWRVSGAVVLYIQNPHMQSKLTGLYTVAAPGGGEPATLATGRCPGSSNVTVKITRSDANFWH